MAYDLEEQEQIANFKAFWKQYGNLITWVLIIAPAGYAAYNFWNSHQRNQSARPRPVRRAGPRPPAKDNAKVQRIAGDIESKFDGTAYAPDGRAGRRQDRLRRQRPEDRQGPAAVGDRPRQRRVQVVARLRLSGVLLDEKPTTRRWRC
jgi:predicted negative regulator of RcsB-dependent stress response